MGLHTAQLPKSLIMLLFSHVVLAQVAKHEKNSLVFTQTDICTLFPQENSHSSLSQFSRLAYIYALPRDLLSHSLIHSVRVTQSVGWYLLFLRRRRPEYKAIARAAGQLPDGYSQIFRSHVFGPSGLNDYCSATLCCKI